MNFNKNTKTQFNLEPTNNSSVSTSSKTGMSRVYKSVFVVELILIFITLGLIIYLELNKPSQKIASATAKTKVIQMQKPSSAEQSRVNSGLAPIKTSAKVNIVYVKIPTGVQEDKNSAGDSAATAAGHFAYIDGSDSTGYLDGATGGKVIYDGKVVYQGEDVVQDNIVISKNGLHYGYIRDDGTNYNIYVDNKMVQSVSDSDTVTIDGVSDDGLSYAYNDSSGSGKFIELLNGSNLYTSSLYPESIGNLQLYLFGGDLKHYISVLSASESSSPSIYNSGGFNNNAQPSLPASDQRFSYISNGTVSKTDINGLESAQISANGKHFSILGSKNSSVTTSATVPNPIKSNTNYCTAPATSKNCASAPATIKKDSTVTTSSTILNVDGKEVYVSKNYKTKDYLLTGDSQLKKPEYLAVNVNNKGDYAYISTAQAKLIIDNKYVYSLEANNLSDNTSKSELITINDSLTHYAYGNYETKYWMVDGVKTALSGDIFNLELNGDNLYVYQWSN